LARRLVGVGCSAPEKFRHALFGDGDEGCGDSSLAKIFLRQHIARDLAPLRGNFDVGLGEDDGTVRVSDLAGRSAEFDGFVGGTTFDRELTVNAHGTIPGYLLRPLPPLPGTVPGTVFPPPGGCLSGISLGGRFDFVRQIWCRDQRQALSMGTVQNRTQARSS